MSNRPNAILDNRYDFNDNHLKSLETLIYKAANNYSKILPVRIDFHLSSPIIDTEIDREDFMNYWQRMQNRMRRNQKFDHLITFVAKFEYGYQRGWHMHVLFLFNGQKVKDGFSLSRELGEYWAQTVKPENLHVGTYHSCNMERNNYKQFVLNMINASESLYQKDINPNAYTDLDALIDACSYLTKIHHYTIDYLIEQGYSRLPRTIIFGQVRSKSNAGRPRKTSILSNHNCHRF